MSVRTEIIQGYPEHLKEFIDQRYKTYTLSRNFVDKSYSLKNVVTLLMYEQEVLKEALLFVITKSTCRLLNDLVYIPQENLKIFCDTIFGNYKKVKQIVIIWQKEKPLLPYSIKRPGQVDVMIKLPKNKEGYDAMLGKKMRTQMRYYFRKIQKDYSGVVFRMNIPCTELSMEDWKYIVGLKENRQYTKKLHNTFNEDKVRREIAIYNEMGRISLVTHTDKIIAALLSYKVEDNIFAIMVAFDINYYKYSVARVLFYESIIDSIEQQNTEYHLLWRNAEYMDHYGGEDLKLYSASVFRGYGLRYLCELVRTKWVFCYRNFKSSKVGQFIKPWLRRLKS